MHALRCSMNIWAYEFSVRCTCDQILRMFETSSRIAEGIRAGEHALQLDRLFEIDRSRGDKETVCLERNYTYVEQSAISRSYILTLIVYESRTPAESLAFHLDECVPEKKTKRWQLAPQENSNENEGEEERDGNTSEPIRLTKMQKKRRADETAKELRALLPKTTSSHANPSRSDDETQKWLVLSTLLIRWCHVCSAQSMICRVISK